MAQASSSRLIIVDLESYLLFVDSGIRGGEYIPTRSPITQSTRALGALSMSWWAGGEERCSDRVAIEPLIAVDRRYLPASSKNGVKACVRFKFHILLERLRYSHGAFIFKHPPEWRVPRADLDARPADSTLAKNEQRIFGRRVSEFEGIIALGHERSPEFFLAVEECNNSYVEYGVASTEQIKREVLGTKESSMEFWAEPLPT
ncbi:hypothetical protein FB451DRAFT_1183184 [Mycena latifolia]|nr:hypothetical protein FB451DRAFT_1183184 [Mycena latifolia]